MLVRLCSLFRLPIFFAIRTTQDESLLTRPEQPALMTAMDTRSWKSISHCSPLLRIPTRHFLVGCLDRIIIDAIAAFGFRSTCRVPTKPERTAGDPPDPKGVPEFPPHPGTRSRLHIGSLQLSQGRSLSNRGSSTSAVVTFNSGVRNDAPKGKPRTTHSFVNLCQIRSGRRVRLAQS